MEATSEKEEEEERERKGGGTSQQRNETAAAAVRFLHTQPKFEGEKKKEGNDADWLTRVGSRREGRGVPCWWCQTGLGRLSGWGRSRRGEKSEVLAPKTKPIFGNPASRQKQSREERNFLPLAKQSVRKFQMGKGEEEEEEKLQPKKGAPRDQPFPF